MLSNSMYDNSVMNTCIGFSFHHLTDSKVLGPHLVKGKQSQKSFNLQTWTAKASAGHGHHSLDTITNMSSACWNERFLAGIADSMKFQCQQKTKTT